MNRQTKKTPLRAEYFRTRKALHRDGAQGRRDARTEPYVRTVKGAQQRLTQ